MCRQYLLQNGLEGDSEKSVHRDPYQLCSKGQVTLGLLQLSYIVFRIWKYM